MFYITNDRNNPNAEEENFKIGVAVADSPSGPFTDLYNRPVFEPEYPVIDANVLFDDETGKNYLYFSRWRGTETGLLRNHRRTCAPSGSSHSPFRPAGGMGKPLCDMW